MSNTAPDAPTLSSPTASTTIDYAYIQRFSWIFSDPDVGDSQSRFDLQYRIVGAGSWTTVSATTPNNFYDLPAVTLTANNYEWQVRTYDSIGVVGPWSASSFFTAATAPSTLSITAPTSGTTVSAAPTFTWSTPTQTSYEIRRIRDITGTADPTTIYYDTGEVIASATRSAVLSMDTNNRYEWLQIRVKASGLWSSWVSIRVLASYTQPSPGTITAVGDDTTASLLITTTAATVGGGEPTPIFVDIYVRVAGTTGFGDRIAAAQFPTGTFRWYTPISGTSYEVRSLTTADNGAQRWSTWVFVHFIDGGTPVAPAWTMTLDGGTPTTAFVNNVDGGSP
jgi:hypothetical protein